MVSIRLQRRGRRGQAQFRMVVQDSRRAPTSGRVIANLGFYNPHTKEHGINLELLQRYLNNGAQPSERVVKFLTDQQVKLPAWVKPLRKQQQAVRYPDKLRRHQRSGSATTPAAPQPPVDPSEAEASAASQPPASPPVSESNKQVSAPTKDADSADQKSASDTK